MNICLFFYLFIFIYLFIYFILFLFFRSAEVFFSVVCAQLVAKKKAPLLKELQGQVRILEAARQGQATFMHHDAITGTSKKAVMKDYANM
jgi:hypothetical protein